jgi:hypothetical protein
VNASGKFKAFNIAWQKGGFKYQSSGSRKALQELASVLRATILLFALEFNRDILGSECFSIVFAFFNFFCRHFAVLNVPLEEILA